jgi:PEP-CTERM motif-containing protein
VHVTLAEDQQSADVDWDAFAFSVPVGSSLVGIGFAAHDSALNADDQLAYRLVVGNNYLHPHVADAILQLTPSGSSPFRRFLPLAPGTYGLQPLWATSGGGVLHWAADYTWTLNVSSEQPGPPSPAPTPEPASLLLLGGGLAVLSGTRRR